MKVCVTGGAGYIGSHLVPRLIGLGHEVTVIDDMSNGSYHHPMVKFYSHDIREIDQIENALGGTEVFFHLAANKQATSNEDYEMISVNVGGTTAVMETAKRVGARRVVFSSSAAVYHSRAHKWYPDLKIREEDASHSKNTPQNIYGLSKLLAERVCSFMANDKTSVACLRYFNVWGGNYSPDNTVKSAIEIFREKKAKGEPVKVYGDGSAVRDYVHVNDVVEANLAAMRCELNFSSAWNICTGKGVSIIDVVRRECGKDYPVEFLPKRSNEVDYSVGCPERANSSLKWYASHLYT